MPELIRPAPTKNDLRWDALLAAGIAVSLLISASLSSLSEIYGEKQADFWTVPVYAGVVFVGLAVRRKYPCASAIVVCGAYFLAVSIRVPEVTIGNAAMFISIYTAGAWSNHRLRSLWTRIGIIAGMGLWLLIVSVIGSTSDEASGGAGISAAYGAFMLVQFISNAFFFGGTFYLGERSYADAIVRVTLEQRTRELVREQEKVSDQAVALDRVRIARELHDVVAHHVSAMGVQAAAARAVIDANPAAAERTLAGIESSARSAIDELHGLLDTLRDPEGVGSTGPAPSTVGLSDIDELISNSNALGIPTELKIVGQRIEVPSFYQVNLYRIAQEALTNARRHGGPDATAVVTMRYREESVELEVSNTGRSPRKKESRGLGLVGMKERVAACGGTMEAGVSPRGGFLVRVALPVRTST